MAAPLDGAGLDGLENLFSIVIVQDENRNITVTSGDAIPDRIQCAGGLEVRTSATGQKSLSVKEAVKKGGLIFASKPLLNIVDDDEVLKVYL